MAVEEGEESEEGEEGEVGEVSEVGEVGEVGEGVVVVAVSSFISGGIEGTKKTSSVTEASTSIALETASLITTSDCVHPVGS